jgi:hypothetical protein
MCVICYEKVCKHRLFYKIKMLGKPLNFFIFRIESVISYCCLQCLRKDYYESGVVF